MRLPRLGVSHIDAPADGGHPVTHFPILPDGIALKPALIHSGRKRIDIESRAAFRADPGQINLFTGGKDTRGHLETTIDELADGNADPSGHTARHARLSR